MLSGGGDAAARAGSNTAVARSLRMICLGGLTPRLTRGPAGGRDFGLNRLLDLARATAEQPPSLLRIE